MRLLLTLVASAGLYPAVAAAQASPTWPDGVDLGPPVAPARPTSSERQLAPTAPIPWAVRHPPIVSATITPFAIPWHIFEITRPNLYPIFAMALELRAHPSLGIAVMGLADDETNTNGSVTSHDTFYEIGVEPRWYPMGHFRGLMAGAALHYFRLHMILTDVYTGSSPWPFDFAGYTYGAFAGYKYTALIGFTVEVKGGFAYVKRTMSDSGPHPDFVPITDVKIGWSF